MIVKLNLWLFLLASPYIACSSEPPPASSEQPAIPPRPESVSPEATNSLEEHREELLQLLAAIERAEPLLRQLTQQDDDQNDEETHGTADESPLLAYRKRVKDDQQDLLKFVRDSDKEEEKKATCCQGFRISSFLLGRSFWGMISAPADALSILSASGRTFFIGMSIFTCGDINLEILFKITALCFEGTSIFFDLLHRIALEKSLHDQRELAQIEKEYELEKKRQREKIIQKQSDDSPLLGSPGLANLKLIRKLLNPSSKRMSNILERHGKLTELSPIERNYYRFMNFAGRNSYEPLAVMSLLGGLLESVFIAVSLYPFEDNSVILLINLLIVVFEFSNIIVDNLSSSAEKSLADQLKFQKKLQKM